MKSESTLEYLKTLILHTQGFIHNEVTVDTVGTFLCGYPNKDLAKNPFSEQFLCNVAYNSVDSMPCILWLQLNAINNR